MSKTKKISFQAQIKQRGVTLLLVLIFSSVFIIMGVGLIGLVVSHYKLSTYKIEQASALEIAEAGANYYLWHLAHNQNDFKDGHASDPLNPDGTYGPYVHDYRDAAGNLIGQFSLYITPPYAGSTIVTIKSTGYTLKSPNITRRVSIRAGIRSLTDYAVLADDNMRFGTGTEVWGPIHANGGIRFDGVAHNIVSSSKQCYDDPDTSYVNSCERPGVWTSQSDESLVFLAGKKFPVVPIDFKGVTVDLAKMKTQAQADNSYYSASGKEGYWVHLNTNNTYDIYKVKSVSSRCSVYGTWTDTNKILQTISPSLGNPIPPNGVIFIEDKVWVDGKINQSRVVIVAAKEPLDTGQADIIINNDVEYTNYDGQDTIGLIAQRNISIGLYSEGNFSGTADEMELRIDAALFAQKGRVGRDYFTSSCSSTYYKRNIITTFGSLGTAKRYGFSWICGGVWCSGYQTRNIIYDDNLTFSPPPFFPTTGVYEMLSWEES